MLSYRPLHISVSLQDKHDYSPRLCHSNRTSLPAPPSWPLAIYPDMCNQLEQQILVGEKKKKPVILCNKPILFALCNIHMSQRCKDTM